MNKAYRFNLVLTDGELNAFAIAFAQIHRELGEEIIDRKPLEKIQRKLGKNPRGVEHLREVRANLKSLDSKLKRTKGVRCEQ